MEAGDISMPIKTRFGYHLIEFHKKIPKGVQPFDEVKESIISKLKKKDWGIDIADYYDNMTSSNKMKIDNDTLDAYLTKKLMELDK
jgi:parvulin-like peptidyl-prolyl isomerase